MWPKGKSLGRVLARFASPKPEQLWQQYLAALLILGVVITVGYIADNRIAQRTLIATQGIRDSNAQMKLAQDILGRTSNWESQHPPEVGNLLTTIDAFERLGQTMLDRAERANGAMPPGVADRQLPELINAFVEQVRAISDVSAEGYRARHQEILAIYHEKGLHDALVGLSMAYANQLSDGLQRQNTLRSGLFLAAVVILLVEGLLIFGPGQYAVGATITKLRRQKDVLTASRNRLLQSNDHLQRHMRKDQLTGLPNRTSLIAYLERIFRQRETDDLSLYLIGLDGFKAVNDMIGHDYGDALLSAIGTTLQNCIDSEDMIARVGGDEFVIVTSEDRVALLDRFFAAVKTPVDVKGRRIPVKISCGHLEIGQSKRKPMEVLADAEIALQVAKGNGGGYAQEFTQSLRDNISLMQELQLELQEALQNGEIEPWFQPQINLADGKLHGAEVLVRWRHKTRGLLPPMIFLQAAERAGLIVELDHAVWRAAIQQASTWQREDIWKPVISLNAAPDTLADPNLVERFLLLLSRSGLDVDQIVIEVLETTLIESHDDMAAINIDQLAECGIALELDDFGTGHASLSKLTQLPIAGIKLDRSLIEPLPGQAANSVIRAILALASELGLSVVAEGVEVEEQATQLTHMGCGVAQGYGFGRPMSSDDFTEWLRKHAQTPVEMLSNSPPKARRA